MKSFVRRVYIVGLAFALVMTLNTFFGFRQMEAPLRRAMERSITVHQDYVVRKISSVFAQVEQTLGTVETLIQLEDNESKIQLFFQELLQQNSFYQALYFITTENKLIYAGGGINSENPNPRTQAWYQTAERDSMLIVSAPYVGFDDDLLITTIAKPIYNETEELRGILYVDASIDPILRILELERASEHSCSILFNLKEDIMIHPRRDHSFYGGSAPIVDPNLVQVFRTEPRGLMHTVMHGRDGYFYWQKIDKTGFVLGTFAPINDFLNRRAQTKLLIVTIIISLLSIVTALFVYQRNQIGKPLILLEQDIKDIASSRDLSYRLPVHDGYTYGNLRDTINTVLAKTQEYMDSITYQQEELAAAFSQLVAHEEQLQVQYGEIKQHENRMQYLADHDPLTNLYNRRRFEEDLKKSLAAGQGGAVLMLDIDDFKDINNTQGHIYGDQVLQYVAQVLNDNLPERAIAYRFSGDEFLILVDAERGVEEIGLVIERIAGYLNTISPMEGHYDRVTISVGIVKYPFDGSTIDDLLIKADIALYNAKRNGKNRYLFFEESMAATFGERVAIERVLLKASQTEGFSLVYQPIIKTGTGEVAYFEALIRLRNHSLLPSAFIPIAEESALILTIGRWVIKEAVGQLSLWQKMGGAVKPISINLSAKQFYDEDFVEFLMEQLEKHDVPPNLIELEITETILIDNALQAIEIIKRLKSLGITMALDDFGTGYSSINYITRIPVDRIKLDRSVTEKLTENLLVLDGLVTIAHGLGMDVVAEGVETLEEARFLLQIHCDYLQGYLFSPPLAAQQMMEVVNTDYYGLFEDIDLK